MDAAKSGEADRALKLLTSALQRFPRNVRLLTSAAVLEGRRGAVGEARALFHRGHLLEPSNAVLLRVRAHFFMRSSLPCLNSQDSLGTARRHDLPLSTQHGSCRGSHSRRSTSLHGLGLRVFVAMPGDPCTSCTCSSSHGIAHGRGVVTARVVEELSRTLHQAMCA